MAFFGIRLIRYIRSCDSGFTVVELLVTSLLGLVITSLCLSIAMMNRNVLGRDTARTRLNQNLRGAIDILTTDGRVTGENLDTLFPAIELVNGAGSNPDTLTLRRNLQDEILKVCTSIVAGSNVRQVYFAVPGNTPGCIYSGQAQNYNSWRNYRLAQGGQVDAFIYNSVTKQGEFFTYNSEADTGTSYYIQRPNGGTWANSYPNTSSSVYLLEEWKYQIQNSMLQIVENRDTANPYNVSFGVTNFQVQFGMRDGTIKYSFTTADAWTDISSIQVTLSGQDEFAKQTVARTVVGQFFPRNVLSH